MSTRGSNLPFCAAFSVATENDRCARMIEMCQKLLVICFDRIAATAYGNCLVL